MPQTKTFYYKFRFFDTLFFLNLLLILALIHCCSRFPGLLYWPQVRILIALTVVSSLIWAYLHLIKHKLAVTDDKGITIDHCRPLLWKDIKNAEERVIRCCFKKRRIIVLNPKEGIDYKYNFLQRHNGEFTPFSIPLYPVVSPEDAAEITEIIAGKVDLKKL